MKKFVMTVAAVLAATAGASAAIDSTEAARLAAASRVVQDIHTTIPQDYWSRARCVAVIPDLKKAAFVLGGEYGKGVMSCRSGDGWSAPVFMQLAKGSWGFQIGAEQVDLVMLIMNEQGAQKLLDNKVNLGVDASVAAGPVGRQAQASTDAALKAEILAYSRASGLFAGINLSGGVLRPDDASNHDAYGNTTTPRAILARTGITAPAQATSFLHALDEVYRGASDRPVASNGSPAADGAGGTGNTARAVPAQPAAGPPPTTDSDLRTRAVDMQQTLARILPDTGTGAAPVGTSGSNDATVTVQRSDLMKLRTQLDALIAAMGRQ